MRRPPILITLGAAGLLAASVAAPSVAAPPTTDTSALRDAVTIDGVMQHLEEFQAIADANDGTRAGGSLGYDASADYVADQLIDAGYAVRQQQFTYDRFRQVGPSVLDVTPDGASEPYVDAEDFVVMEYSGSGEATASIAAVDLVLPPGAAANSSSSGCESTDFAGFPVGAIALMQRGTCTFRLKVENAETAGASAAIVFNEGQEGRTDLLSGTLSPPQVGIPAVGTTFAVGDEIAGLLETGEVTGHVLTDVTVDEDVPTVNILADSTAGRTDRTVVVGGHLDSVLEGPGINDNGSGTGSILEIALQMAELGIEPRNRVRFAFWGAEESGLIGSDFYVGTLPKAERKDIALYLNFDMVGSPNFVRFVYDGDGSAFGLKGPSGSAHIEDTFTSYFASQGLESAPTAFDGRSDYQAFIDVGIPAGGLFTGAEGIKTEEQADVYGGTAGIAYDPCYHQACDTIDNVNPEAIDQMSDAIAHTALTYAMSKSGVNGTKASAPGGAAVAELGGPHARR